MIVLDKKILVVDDQPEITDIICEFIKEKYPNVKTTEANSSIEALDIACSNKYDLIITDYHMPEKNGVQIVREIRENAVNKRTPIIFITAMKTEVEEEIGNDIENVYIFNKVDKIQLIVDLIEKFIS